MYVFRLARAAYESLDGEGARLYGGRWNSPGTPVVYTSSSRALAALEYLANVDVADVPDDLVLCTIEVPDDAPAERLTAASLPDDWTQVPPSSVSRERGDTWAGTRNALLLRVPAVLVPEEEHVLLNPAHDAMTRVRVVTRRAFAFDERLLKH